MRKAHRIIIPVMVLAISVSMIPRARANRTVRAIPLPKIVKEIKIGEASWYSRRSPGVRRRTANNEIFDDKAMTCAMWGVPFHQKLRVTNMENGKSIIVRVNDRGPHRRFVRRGRILDLTKRAFEYLDSTKKGLIKVKVELL